MTSGYYSGVLGLCLLALPAAAAGPAKGEAPKNSPQSAATTQCRQKDPLRMPFFGETHVHTGYSFDAYSIGTHNTPGQAYAYAKGQPIYIADDEGEPTRCAQLARPLDWAAITDHSEFLGEMHMCLNQSSAYYNSADCIAFRANPGETSEVWGEGLTLATPTPPAFCSGPQGPNATCYDQSLNLWSEIRSAAEAAYDRSEACTFTSFIGYEWTSMPGYNNRHRNVIFRNHIVPYRPVTVFETTNDETKLWQLLDRDCKSAEGCEALTIPHNGNLSDGMLYTVPLHADANYARDRSKWEPLSEIHQGKGNSECRTGVGTDDPECGFEQLSDENLNFVEFSSGESAKSKNDEEPTFEENSFLRNVLKIGLSEEARLGANPFKFGFAGGTDSHNALPGGTDEGNFLGIHGVQTANAEGLLSQVQFNPGALTVAWAEQNSRDAIFDALKNRETYATSGSRPIVRFFGGWNLPSDMCTSGNFAQQGYAHGKPMGADLTAPPAPGAKPSFAVLALKDPGSQAPTPLPAGNCAVYSPGARLQRIEIVKGWLDASGAQREKVVTVVGPPNAGGATVDPGTCAPSQTAGSASLCTIWTDNEFDPSQRAFYYARLLENPTCRWSTYTCKDSGLDPFNKPACLEHLAEFSQVPPDSGAPSPYEIFSVCCNMQPGPVVAPTEIPIVEQQRAWTSPMWFTPAATSATSAKKKN